MDMRITIIVDNVAEMPGLTAEYGLAAFVEPGHASFLFDTGQSGALIENARTLGISLEQASAIILSHGHFDHTGGLTRVLALEGGPKHIYAHPQVLGERYSRHPGEPPKSIGMPEDARHAWDAHAAHIHWVEATAEIAPGVWLTGPIPRETAFEDTGGPFFLDPSGMRPDLLPDDQAMWLETKQGLVVLLGCAHSGVANTLHFIAKHTGASQFHMIIGGMHLMRASESRIRATADTLRQFHVHSLAPCHCTGDEAIASLRNLWNGTIFPCASGSQFIFPAA